MVVLTRYWPPGSLNALGAKGLILQRDWLSMWIKIICLKHILSRILTNKSSLCDVVNNLKKLSVKDVPINNYELLNIQASSFHAVWNKGCTQGYAKTVFWGHLAH